MKKDTNLIKLLFTGAALLVIVVVYYFTDARVSHFFPSCPFQALTGLFCPGCGSQRAFSALLHANFISALDYNILLVACLPLLTYSAVATVINTISKKQVDRSIFYSPLFAKIFLVTVIAFGILRNIPVYPFLILAP